MVRCCINRYNCTDCKTDLVKAPPAEPTQVLPDEQLVNQEYRNIDTPIYPSDEAVEAVETALNAFDKLFPKILHRQGLRARVLKKTKQVLNKKNQPFLKFGTSCSSHRDFFLNKIIVAKIRRCLCDMSKDMRQSHTENNASVAKLSN